MRLLAALPGTYAFSLHQDASVSACCGDMINMSRAPDEAEQAAQLLQTGRLVCLGDSYRSS